ncbi:MAG: restriction endonuclease [Lachnospiraceae bacterium]|nr:restriction endonuclease [Lachnospiraceae bacterium]MDY5498379.1 restriction endonuclease [Anaerobutyricum sp.]
MRHFDLWIWLWFSAMVVTYGQGYVFYTGGEEEKAVACTILCACAILLFFRRLFTLRYLHMKMKKIDKLSGRAFERYLAAQFRRLGYRVTLTDLSHDYGADLLLRKWGKKTVVQAKRYEKNVGIAAVQEAVGAIAYYNADRAMVVTNSGFTKSARNLAWQNEVELWGRNEIRENFHIEE